MVNDERVLRCAAVFGRGHAAAPGEQETVSESRGVRVRSAEPLPGHHQHLPVHPADRRPKPQLTGGRA